MRYLLQLKWLTFLFMTLQKESFSKIERFLYTVPSIFRLMTSKSNNQHKRLSILKTRDLEITSKSFSLLDWKTDMCLLLINHGTNQPILLSLAMTCDRSVYVHIFDPVKISCIRQGTVINKLIIRAKGAPRRNQARDQFLI